MTATIETKVFQLVFVVDGNDNQVGNFSTPDEATAAARQRWSETSASLRFLWDEIAIVDQDGNRSRIYQRPVAPKSLVPGYYSVDGKRYHVSIPGERSKWAGFVFVSTGSDYHDRKNVATFKPDGSFSYKTTEHGKKVARAILANPRERMADYGRITGSCGKCGRKLEDPASIQRGLGPTCAKSFS